MAEGDKCGNCKYAMFTVGITNGICVLPSVPAFLQQNQRYGEVNPENTVVCEYYQRKPPGQE